MDNAEPETAGREITEAAEQPRHERLFWLWVICVLNGAGVAAGLPLLALAKPLGLLVLGAPLLLSAALMLGLWRRSNLARIVVMVLLGLNGALGLFLFIQDPAGGVGPPIQFVVSLAILGYLFWRGRHFKVEGPPPGLRGAAGITALALILIAGLFSAYITLVGEPRREFPFVTEWPEMPPEEENACVALIEMEDDLPPAEVHYGEVADGMQTTLLCQIREEPRWVREADDEDEERDALSPVEAWAHADTIVKQWEHLLPRLDDIIARPHFATPGLDEPENYIGRTQAWIPATDGARRVLVTRAMLQIRAGRIRPALEDAQRVSRLGRLVTTSNDGVLSLLIGGRTLSYGLYLYRAAAAAAAEVREVPNTLQEVPTATELKDAVRRAAALELHGMTAFLRGLRQGRVPHGLAPHWAGMDKRLALLRVPMPYVKPNMVHNDVGDWLRQHLRRLESWSAKAPSAEEENLLGFDSLEGRITSLDFVRNPVGTIVMYMLVPSLDEVVELCHRKVMERRMTRLFLALRRYHLEHGRLPQTLDELAPRYVEEVPLDPFVEAPFHYEPDAETPHLYSVGPDGETAGHDIKGDLELWEEKAGRQARDDLYLYLDFAVEEQDATHEPAEGRAP